VLAAAVVDKPVYALVEVDGVGATAAADRVAFSVRDVDGVAGRPRRPYGVVARSTEDAPRSLVGCLLVPGIAVDVVVAPAADELAVPYEVVVACAAREDVASYLIR
jgi:hypothetical protein